MSRGDLIAQGVNHILQSCDPGFSPHSIHVLLTDIQPESWTIERISEGRNFNNRQAVGYKDGKIACHISCSLTSRNSVADLVSKYEAYEQLIKQRRSEGKTEDDDDDDDIQKLSPPLVIQPPVPQMSQSENVKTTGVLEIQMPKNLGTEFTFAARVKQSSGDQFLDLVRATDATQILRVQTQDMVIYIHDNEFDACDWMTIHARLLSMSYGRELYEFEIYQKGIHFLTIQQENLQIVAKI